MGDATNGTGIGRRELLKRGAIVSAGAWTAPVILDSFLSPAAASSISFPSGCSYGLIVFTYNGQGPYIVRISENQTTCTSANGTSNDDSFTGFTCGADTYQGNVGHSQTIDRNGTAVPAFPGTCSDLFSVSGSTYTTKVSGITILFGVSHHGPSSGYQGTKFYPVCGNGAQSMTLNCS